MIQEGPYLSLLSYNIHKSKSKLGNFAICEFFQRTKDLDTAELLEQLPTLQQLLHRVIDCQVSF